MDENKKPGPRDISDLKARLGLKKTGVMPAVAPNTTPPHGQPAASQPSAPPPPMGQPQQSRPLPSPFGQPEPPPPQPAAPPDPRRDPFAQQQAANLAAFYGVGQVMPGSAEGVSDTPIAKGTPWGSIGVALLAGVALFGVGNACGRIYSSRVEYNITIDQAGQIREEVDKMSKQLNSVADVLNSSKETQKGNVDFDMTSKLGALNLAKPDSQKIFHTNYAHFEDPAIERLFLYYDHTIRLYDEITKHAKVTDTDKDTLTSYMKNSAGRGDKNYGVTLDLTGAIPLAHFVELGAPVCPAPDQVDCPPSQLKGFKYRADASQSWGEKPVKGKPGETVTPLQPSGLFKQVAAGNPDVLAFEAYKRRVIGIKGLAMELVAEQKEVLADLKKQSERPKVFTF